MREGTCNFKDVLRHSAIKYGASCAGNGTK